MLQYPDGVEIVSGQQQQELAYMIKSDLDASEGMDGNVADSDSTGQAWQAASAEVAAIQQQEAGSGAETPAADARARDARWLARYSEGDEWTV